MAATVAGLIVAGSGVAWFLLQRQARGPLKPVPASLAVEWRGRTRGRMVLPARINWCPVTRVGVLEAVSGDSGVGIVLYERDAMSNVAHPVVGPDLAASAPRPGATLAMRWMRFEPDTTLAGYRSVSGTIQLRVGSGKASGDVNARLRSLTGPDTLVVHGIFQDVPIVSTAVGCS